MPHILRRLKINEVSSVDRGANQGARVLLMKRHDDNAAIIDDGLVELAGYIDSIMVNKNIVDKDAEISACIRSFGGYLKRNVVVTDDDEPTPQPTEKLQEMVVALCNLLPGLSVERAVMFLATKPGAALIAALSKNKKEQPTMTTRTEELRNYVKSDSNAMAAIAAHIIAKGATALSEHEWTAAFTEYCKLHKRDGESTVSAFSRILEDPDSSEFRRSLGIVKGYPDVMPTDPMSVEVGSSLDPEDGKKAWDQAMELAEKMHKTSPEKSIQWAFTRIMELRPDLERRTRGLTEQDVKGRKRPNASSPSYDAVM